MKHEVDLKEEGLVEQNREARLEFPKNIWNNILWRDGKRQRSTCSRMTGGEEKELPKRITSSYGVGVNGCWWACFSRIYW